MFYEEQLYIIFYGMFMVDLEAKNGKVKEINVVQRKEIAEIPKASDELYCRFEIEEWVGLLHKIISNGFSLRRSMIQLFIF